MSLSRPLAVVVQLSAREPSDALLVSRVRSRVAGAEEALYMRHVGATLGLCQRLVGDRDEAEDVLQETFIEVFDQLHTLRKPAQLGRWIAGIAVARAELVFRRRRARRLVRVSTQDERATFLRAAPEVSAMAREQLGQLDVQLGKLRDRDRATWLLHVVDGYTLAELSELTHRPVSIVRRRLQRAERALRMHEYSALTSLAALLDQRRPTNARELLRVFLARRELRARSHAPLSTRLRVVLGVALVVALVLLGADKHARHESLPLTLKDQRNLPSAMLTNASHHAFDLSDGSRLTLAPGARLDVVESSTRELVLSQRTGRVRFDIQESGRRTFRIENGPLSVSTRGGKLIIERTVSSIDVRVKQGDVLLRGAPVPDRVLLLGAGQSFHTALPHE